MDFDLSPEDEAFREKMVSAATERITAYMTTRPKEFREAVAGNGRRGAPYPPARGAR